MFIGRERELKKINYYLSTPGFECILIYSQRHMGKTSLIEKAIDNHEGKTIRYECILSYTNLDNLSKCVIDCFKEDLTDYVFGSYKSLYQYVFDRSVEEHFSDCRVDYYLNKLKEIKIIEKNKDGYVISNKPFCFYYHYVFNNLQLRNCMDARINSIKKLRRN